MSPSVAGSRTTNLSFGERPVCGDVTAHERAHVGELALAAARGGEHQLGRHEVPMDLTARAQPLLSSPFVASGAPVAGLVCVAMFSNVR